MKSEQKVIAYLPNRDGGKMLDADPMRTISLVVRTKRGDEGERGSGMRTLIQAAIWGSKSGNSASIWVHCGERYAAGHGKARGYGYHRPSAALQEAITSAGIQLSLPINGRGESAMDDALRAIARHLGYRHCLIV